MIDPLSSSACPDCGAPLPPDCPQALCPTCLMRQALASRTIANDGGTSPHLPPPPPEEIADKFLGYEILECLGRGGMGVVYKARQKSLNRTVAIKILAPERVDDGRFAERFTIEAELLAKLSHPHIVTIHDFGETGGLFYLVMEFIDGVNLRDLLRDGKLEPKQALAIVPPICDALQYAHDKGIVHRDIKPENLLLDRDGRIKIADFGIAKLIEPLAAVYDRRSVEEEKQRRSQSDATLNAGTLGYSAPEQANGTADHRADIYALGVVLYEMLTGERPNKDLVAPSKKVQIDVRLDEIVLRALEKTPALRYQTAGEFRTVLETMVDDSRGTVRTPSPGQAAYASVPPHWLGYEYKSRRTLCGLPLLHVVQGIDPATGKQRKARGIIAIGGIATGWLAMGGRAYGGIAFGGIAVGGLAIGGCAAGLISFGGLSVALLLAVGGLAVAPVAFGGLAMGYLAMGGMGLGAKVFDGRQQPVSLKTFFDHFQSWGMTTLWSIWIVLFAGCLSISAWAKRRATRKADSSEIGKDDSNGKPIIPETEHRVVPRSSVCIGSLLGILMTIIAIAGIVFAVKIVPQWEEAWTMEGRALSVFGVVLVNTAHVIQRIWPWVSPFLLLIGGVSVLNLVGVSKRQRAPSESARIVRSSIYWSVLILSIIGLLVFLLNILPMRVSPIEIRIGALEAAISAVILWLIIRIVAKRENALIKHGPLHDPAHQSSKSGQASIDQTHSSDRAPGAASRFFRKAIVILAIALSVIIWLQRPVMIDDHGVVAESPDGKFSAMGHTWCAMRIMGSDHCFYRFTVQGRAGTVFKKWDVAVPLEKLATSHLVMSRDEFLFGKRGMILWSDDSKRVSFQVKGIEVSAFDAESGKPTLQPAEPPHLSFGPIVESELEIPAKNSLPTVALDLDRGEEIPISEFTGDVDEDRAWVAGWKQQGADLFCGSFDTSQVNGTSPPDEGPSFYEHGLATVNELGMRVMAVKPDLWDSADARALLAMNPALAAQEHPDQYQKLVPQGQTPQTPKGKLPATFLFKTAEGNLGLIQILDFTEAMRSVKIRYKLVRKPAETKSADPKLKRLPGNVPGLEITGPAEGFTQALLRGWVEKRWRTEYPNEMFEPLEWGEPESIAPHGWVAIRVKFIWALSKRKDAKRVSYHRYYSFTKTGDFVRTDGVEEPAKPAEISPSAFGQVIERVVNDDGAKKDFFIDFDSGNLFSPPPGLRLTDKKAFGAWMREKGVDAMGETSTSIRGLVGMELVARPMAGELWESLTARDALHDEALQANRDGAMAFLSAKGELPETYLFKTREGGVGLLQITGFKENPRGVRIRYKLVRHEGGTESPSPPR